MNPEIQQEIFGREIVGIRDVLKGYKKSTIVIDGEIYPLAVLDANGSIDGLIIELSDEELEKADGYESDAYNRIQVTLDSGLSTWVYTEVIM